MTDRELLEFAAKAIGKPGEWWDESSCGGAGIRLTEMFLPNWNSLEHPEDAFALMVELSISLSLGPLGPVARTLDNKRYILPLERSYITNPYEAAMRVVTMAAAEIGKAIP
jgi:hypothetical protein